MELGTGCIYKFEFIDKFSSLNGFYRVLKKLHFDEILADKIDLQKNLYEKIGGTKADLMADMVGYITNPFFKLQNVAEFTYNLSDTLDIKQYDLYTSFYTNITTLAADITALKALYEIASIPYTATTVDLAAAVAAGTWTTEQYDSAVALITTIKASFTTNNLVIPVDLREPILANFDKLILYHPDTGTESPDRTVKTVTIIEGDGLYVPESILKSYPIVDVKEFKKVIVSIDLGVFDETDKLTSMMTRLQDSILNDIGLIVTPSAMVYGKAWLETQAYKDMVEEREIRKGEITNYQTEYVKAQATIAQQNTLIQKLNDIIIMRDGL